ncbi:MAG: esterase family protein [Colwellia sp.]
MKNIFFTVVTLIMLVSYAYADTNTSGKIVIHYEQIESEAIKGNLEGNSPKRELTVFLPPSYFNDKNKRYPVLYALHGYWVNNRLWANEIDAPNSINNAFINGSNEMIVVLPNSQTIHQGSMYTSSVTTGDWEHYIANEVVDYIDFKYRTIPKRESRGLAGHSMGAYGALRIGMRYSDKFSALYAMSPCCFEPPLDPDADYLKPLITLASVEKSFELGFLERAAIAMAAAWSPNPSNPPFYADIPTKNNEQLPWIIARWQANSLRLLTSQHIAQLSRLKAIKIDCGDEDYLKDAGASTSQLMNDFGINSEFQLYHGDHVNKIAERFGTKVLSFFSEKLDFE